MKVLESNEWHRYFKVLQYNLCLSFVRFLYRCNRKHQKDDKKRTQKIPLTRCRLIGNADGGGSMYVVCFPLISSGFSSSNMSSSTSFPLVSPLSYHSTVTERWGGLSFDTMAEWTRPKMRTKKDHEILFGYENLLHELRFLFRHDKILWWLCWAVCCCCSFPATHEKYFPNKKFIINKGN